MVYPQLLQLGKATQSLQRAAELEPQNHFTHYCLGNFLYRLRRLDEAQQSLEHAIALNPKVPEYHRALGQVCLQRQATKKNTERALRHLQQALLLGASEPARVRYDIGVCYQRQEKWKEAIHEWQIAVRLEPSLWGAHYALYDVYTKLGKKAEAQAALAQFRKYRTQEDARMKRLFYEEEVARNRDDPDAYLQLGVFCLRQGETAKALTAFEQAARLAPQDVRVHRRLLEVYEKLGRTKETARERATIRRLETKGR